ALAGHSPAPPATRNLLMTTLIIPHVLSIFRLLERPRLLTRLSRLPIGRHSSSVSLMLSHTPFHSRRAPHGPCRAHGGLVCTHIALTCPPEWPTARRSTAPRGLDRRLGMGEGSASGHP